jgi:hypothetical protein
MWRETWRVAAVQEEPDPPLVDPEVVVDPPLVEPEVPDVPCARTLGVMSNRDVPTIAQPNLEQIFKEALLNCGSRPTRI